MRMTRRTLVKGTAALGAMAAVPSVLHARASRTALFVYDVRFLPSRDLGARWQAAGVPVLDPRDEDLGTAWRRRIPDLLAEGGTIAGATLWSDRMICEIFGRERGLVPADLPAAPDFPAGMSHWSLA